MTTSIFNTKEQYLSFRDAWKTAAKSIKATKATQVRGWIQAEHHILFNVLCRKKIDNGFTPVTNSNKLNNGTHINQGFYFGMSRLRNMQKTALDIINGKSVYEGRARAFAEFIEPFGNTVTVDMIAALDLPEIEPLCSTYGKSRKVAIKIISGDFKPVNFEQVYAALAEVA
jgi:hypothetical protein